MTDSHKNPRKGNMLVATLQNILGQGLPLVVGLLTIPKIKDGLGLESFGLLTLVWAALGYFTFFDLGLGRAVIKSIADYNARGEKKEVVPLTISNLVIIVAMSSFGTVLVWTFSEKLAVDVFHVTSELHSQLITALKLLAVSLPVVTLTAGLRGVLEAHFKFFGINLLQIATGTLTFLSPIFVMDGDEKLVRVVGALCIVRLLGLVAHAILAAKILPGIFNVGQFQWAYFKKTIRFGSWVTVSNVISPIITYADRAVLGSLVPAAQIAYYTTPFEMVSKISIIPGSLARYLFPAFASAQQNSTEGAFKRSVAILSAGLFLVSAIVILLASWGMKTWMGQEFGAASFLLLQVLMIGIYVNSVAYVPYTFLQAFDRPDLTAIIHSFELPLYLGFLYFMTSRFGLLGAAISWSVRSFLDMIFLFIIAKIKFAKEVGSLAKPMFLVLGLSGLLLAEIFFVNMAI